MTDHADPLNRSISVRFACSAAPMSPTAQDWPADTKLASVSSPPPAGFPAPRLSEPHVEASAWLAPALAIPDAAPATARSATTSPNAGRPLLVTTTVTLCGSRRRRPANIPKVPRPSEQHRIVNTKFDQRARLVNGVSGGLDQKLLGGGNCYRKVMRMRSKRASTAWPTAFPPGRSPPRYAIPYAVHPDHHCRLSPPGTGENRGGHA
jgi:hypothetical protein